MGVASGVVVGGIRHGRWRVVVAAGGRVHMHLGLLGPPIPVRLGLLGTPISLVPHVPRRVGEHPPRSAVVRRVVGAVHVER